MSERTMLMAKRTRMKRRKRETSKKSLIELAQVLSGWEMSWMELSSLIHWKTSLKVRNSLGMSLSWTAPSMKNCSMKVLSRMNCLMMLSWLERTML